MTFGFHTPVDLLSWTAAILLGIKAAVTAILLNRPRETWFDTSGGAAMWWASKITPVLAVPCLIAIALIESDRGNLMLYAALMLFVVVAVPIKIWLRFGRRPAI